MDDKLLTDEEISAIRSIYEEDEIFNFDELTRQGKFFIKFESPSKFDLNLGIS